MRQGWVNSGQGIRRRQEVQGGGGGAQRRNKRCELAGRIGTLARQHRNGPGTAPGRTGYDGAHRRRRRRRRRARPVLFVVDPEVPSPLPPPNEQRCQAAAARAGRPAQDPRRVAAGGRHAGHAGPAGLQDGTGSAGPRLARRDREAHLAAARPRRRGAPGGRKGGLGGAGRHGEMRAAVTGPRRGRPGRAGAGGLLPSSATPPRTARGMSASQCSSAALRASMLPRPHPP